jgi:hypothetical protein
MEEIKTCNLILIEMKKKERKAPLCPGGTFLPLLNNIYITFN